MSAIICENCNTKMISVYRNMSRREQIKFYRCPKCRLLWAPKMEVNVSFQSRLDETNRQAALEGVRSREYAQVNLLIQKYVKSQGRGLDVGCAYGWFMKSIGSDYTMEGIEPEAAIVRKISGGVKVYVGFYPYDMPEDAGIYDFIVFNNVWEHINHTSDLIKESKKFVRKGGFLVITVPLLTGGLYRIAELLERLGRTKELARLWQLHFHSPHIYYFSKRNFTDLMAKYNFSLQECQDIRGIDPKRMKERFEMDADERYAGMKAGVFRMLYPLLKQLPADKAVFVFRYNG